MEYQQTKIARRYEGDPELGPILANGQRRALLGWNHFRDNPNGLRSGKLWCWTSAAPGIDPPRHKLQVFDTSGNRAPFPGMRVDCGVASKSSLLGTQGLRCTHTDARVQTSQWLDSYTHTGVRTTTSPKT